jgi:ABC-2 type transport system permease protein
MLRGLLTLTWLEIKIFIREPLGLFGALIIPIVVFVILGRVGDATTSNEFLTVEAPILATLLILLTAVLSLVTIIAIYREGGILKRLRATPLRPATILLAQVLVKLLLTVLTLGLMLAAGARYYPAMPAVPAASFVAALVVSGVSILSLGFVIASLVPTARFAQPFGAAILYPMAAVSGLFIPIDALPPLVRLLARLSPLTYAVSLLKGIWSGGAWTAHAGDVLALVVVTVVCVAISSRFFRWE